MQTIEAIRRKIATSWGRYAHNHRMKSTFALVAMLMASLASAQFTPEQLKVMRERANLPAPKIAFGEFLGAHEADVPERVGIPNPTVKMVLECSGASCTLTLGAARESYPNPGMVKLGLFERTQKSVAQRFAGAQLRGCINLAGDAMPDGPFACKVDGMPDGKESVLLVPPGPPGEEIPLYSRNR
jgi:hypothetical protein